MSPLNARMKSTSLSFRRSGSSIAPPPLLMQRDKNGSGRCYALFLQWVPWLDNPRSWAHHAAGAQGRPNLSCLLSGTGLSLPYWGSEAVRRIDGDADSGTEKKRMLPCNRADRGCVAFLGQHYFAGNGADFSVVLKLENVCRTNQ